MINKVSKLTKFLIRMEKIGIKIELRGNIPWIYISKINGKVVTERFYGEHGFTLGFYPTRIDDEFDFIDIKEIFKLIRKYEH